MRLNLEIKIFVMHVVILKVIILVDLLREITISAKNSDYANIFLPKFTTKFLEHHNNNYIIKLKMISNHFMA